MSGTAMSCLRVLQMPQGCLSSDPHAGPRHACRGPACAAMMLARQDHDASPCSALEVAASSGRFTCSISDPARDGALGPPARGIWLVRHLISPHARGAAPADPEQVSRGPCSGRGHAPGQFTR